MSETCPHCLSKAHFSTQTSARHASELHMIQMCQGCGRYAYRLVDDSTGMESSGHQRKFAGERLIDRFGRRPAPASPS